MNHQPLAQSKHDLLVLLAELQKDGGRELLITPEGDKLKAVVRLKGGKRSIMTITLDIPLINVEEALPLFSKVEWDEEKRLVQQRFPVKYLLQSQKPRSKAHIRGLAPKMRRSQRNPYSKVNKNPRSTLKTRQAKRSEVEQYTVAKEHFEQTYSAGSMSFFQVRED